MRLLGGDRRFLVMIGSMMSPQRIQASPAERTIACESRISIAYIRPLHLGQRIRPHLCVFSIQTRNRILFSRNELHNADVLPSAGTSVLPIHDGWDLTICKEELKSGLSLQSTGESPYRGKEIARSCARATVKLLPGAGYGRSSKTRLNDVSLARRKRLNPACSATFRSCASEASVPSAVCPDAMAFGVQHKTEAPE